MKIITKTPLRVSLAGGGTDIPSFYEAYGGAVISTTIDKYVTITVKQSDDDRVHGNVPIHYGIIRTVKRMMKFAMPVEIEVNSDVEIGAGLGGSSALTVGLILALAEYKNEADVSIYEREELARLACDVEITMLGAPIGKQDQYAAAYGGFRRYVFMPDGTVDQTNLGSQFPFKQQVDALKPRLMLFNTKIQRETNTVLGGGINVDALQHIKALEEVLWNTFLIGGDIDSVGSILHTSWQYKRRMANGVTSEKLDKIYDTAMGAGASGGKLLGAGGGGHFLFVVPDDVDQANVVWALDGIAEYVPFNFEPRGSFIETDSEEAI